LKRDMTINSLDRYSSNANICRIYFLFSQSKSPVINVSGCGGQPGIKRSM
jgi:hypothetical protein